MIFFYFWLFLSFAWAWRAALRGIDESVGGPSWAFFSLRDLLRRPRWGQKFAKKVEIFHPGGRLISARPDGRPKSRPKYFFFEKIMNFKRKKFIVPLRSGAVQNRKAPAPFGGKDDMLPQGAVVYGVRSLLLRYLLWVCAIALNDPAAAHLVSAFLEVGLGCKI